MQRASVVAAILLLLVIPPTRAQSPFQRLARRCVDAACLDGVGKTGDGLHLLSGSILTQQNEPLPG